MTGGSTGLLLAATSSSLLSVLKYVLLAVLWVFFILVLRAVLTEVHRPGTSDQAPRRGGAPTRLTGGATRPAPPPRPSSPALPWEEPARVEPAAVGSAGAMIAAAAAASATDVAARAEWASRTGRAASVSALVVVEPVRAGGRSFPLNTEVTIGRATNCDIPMPDDSFVSSRHARVWSRDGATWVEDLGSTNGTLLNGSRLSAPTTIRVGDRIQVGKTVLEAAQ